MKQRHPYDNFTVLAVVTNMGFGSLNAMLAVMAAGEDTGDMVINGTAAAANFGMLWLFVRILDRKQRQQEAARA